MEALIIIGGGRSAVGRNRTVFVWFYYSPSFYLFLFYIIEYADCVSLGFAIHPLRGSMNLSTALFYMSALFFSFLFFLFSHHFVLFLFVASLRLPPLSRMAFLLDVSLLICCCLPMSTSIDQSALVGPFSSSSSLPPLLPPPLPLLLYTQPVK